MQGNSLADLISGGINRGQRTHWFLEDHTNLAAADTANFSPVRIQLGDINLLDLVSTVRVPHASVINDFALWYFSGFRDHLHDGAGRHGLATSAFTNHPQGLAAFDIETDPIHCFYNASPDIEGNMKIFYFNQNIFIRSH